MVAQPGTGQMKIADRPSVNRTGDNERTSLFRLLRHTDGAGRYAAQVRDARRARQLEQIG